MGAITDLWKSERGLLAVLLVVGATVLTALGHMTVAEWRDYTVWIFGIYAGAKTATGVAEVVVGTKKTEPVADPTSPIESKKDPA